MYCPVRCYYKLVSLVFSQYDFMDGNISGLNGWFVRWVEHDFYHQNSTRNYRTLIICYLCSCQILKSEQTQWIQ